MVAAILSTSVSMEPLNIAPTTTTPFGPSKKEGPPAASDSRPVLDDDWFSDHRNPKTWSLGSQIFHTAIPAIYCFVVTFGTSVYSPGMFQFADEFQVSDTLANLGISIYSLGLAFGPMIGGPLSETYGRKSVYLYTLPIFILSTMGVGLAKNAATVIVCRFLAGAAGASCLAVSAGTVADVWEMEHGGGLAAVLVAQTAFSGSSIGPLVGGYTMQTRHDWRWTMWAVLIMTVPIAVAVLCSKETSKKQILKQRARKSESMQLVEPPARPTLKVLATVVLLRPVRMLFTEPIVTSITIYNAFVFGVLFAFFDSYPYVFGKVYGFTSVEVGLAFMGIFIGTALAIPTFVVVNKTLYAKAKAKAVDGKPPPEERLYDSMLGSVGISVSLFWFAWTARSNIHWMVPTAAGVLFGWGIVALFLGMITYLIDTYHAFYGASAIAANTFLRYCVAAGFPLFTIQMYDKLGIAWATSLIGFVSVALLPIPWVLYRWGPFLRSKSAFKPL